MNFTEWKYALPREEDRSWALKGQKVNERIASVPGCSDEEAQQLCSALRATPHLPNKTYL